MAYCYIIYSFQINRYYIGVTQGSLLKRIEIHNSGHYGNHRFTSRAKDWKLYLAIEVLTFDHAVRLERKVKQMKSRVYIENLKKYPELVDKVKSQTNNII